MTLFVEASIIDITNIFRQTMKAEVKVANRFKTGLCHYVYDVKTDAGDFVLRIARPSNLKQLQGGLYWYNRLKPMSIPLPEVYHEDIAAKKSPFHFYIMERLKGTDIQNVYDRLMKSEKEKIAAQIVEIQNKVANLPVMSKFGDFYTSSNDLAYDSWEKFFNVGGMENKLRKLGHFDPSFAVVLSKLMHQNKNYLKAVKPVAYMDDVQMKNVIINESHELSGIVDVDAIRYGDPIENLALTKMAILCAGQNPDYVDMMCRYKKITPTQQKILNLYVLYYCVVFMTETGQAFNKKNTHVDPKRIEYLNRIFRTTHEEIKKQAAS